MEMAKIIQCDAGECAYHKGGTCRAMAITVGGEADHRCDTFCTSSIAGGIPNAIGAVGACKAAACKYNVSLECSAKEIRIGHEGTEVDCLTFEAA